MILNDNMDEEYELLIYHPIKQCNDIILQGHYIWGILRGLETLSQMIVYDYETNEYKINIGIIKDKPRFKHRGLLLDTSRHFHPIPVIQHFIDSLTYAKFNVFHWHIYDEQASPFESKLYPNVWNGSWSKYERYTINDIISIIDYAYERGIRVIPEYDTPGHAGALCKGYPQLCMKSKCKHPSEHLLDPSKQFTWDFLKGIFSEGMDMFNTTKYFHVGCDEVVFSCYARDADIKKYMEKNNFKTGLDVWHDHVIKLHSLFDKTDHRIIVWNEVWDNMGDRIPRDIIIQLWQEGDKKNRLKMLKQGHEIIISYTWYFDWLHEPWDKMYKLDIAENIPDTYMKQILGGEGCMWSEEINVGFIDATVWPRAASVSERLWSRKEIMNVQKAKKRLAFFRCLLMKRNVGSFPFIIKKYGREAPKVPGSCFNQR